MMASKSDERRSATDSQVTEAGESASGEPRADAPVPAEPAQDGETGPPEPLPDDEAFHLLQTRRRRLVLHYLRGREGPVEMRDVAEQVAAWENDTTVQALSSKERQRVYIPLYQTHLPKLDEAGVIEYDQSRGTIRTTERIDQLHRLLAIEGADGDGDATRPPDAVANPDPPTRDATAYYGGASAVSAGLLAAVWSGLLAIPGVLVAALVTAIFAMVTVGTTR